MESESVSQFAIGSMVNKTALNARGVQPSASHPAELQDFKLAFTGDAGMATAVHAPGAKFHGVVHSVSAAEMQILDGWETQVQDRHDARAVKYDGEDVRVTVYSYKKEYIANNVHNAKPSERQMSIIIAGCEYYGVKQEQIDELKQVDYEPRPQEKDLKAVPFQDESCKDKQYTIDEVIDLNTKQGHLGVYFVLNGKVMFSNQNATFVKSWTGQDITQKMATFLQDPMFGIPENPSEIKPLHKKQIEDQFFRFVNQSIGLLK